MSTKINYSKTIKTIFIKTGAITTKNNYIFVNNEPIHKKTGHIVISGSVSMDSKAISAIYKAGLTLTFNFDSSPIFTLSARSGSPLKRNQAMLLGSKPKTVIRRMVEIRNITSAVSGIDGCKESIDINNILISEARFMKSCYAKIAKKAGIKWKGKPITGRETAMHSWWSCLYACIESCLIKMGVDPDLGFIHTCKNGFTYDVADLLKPLFLEESLKHKSSDITKFYELYKERRINRLLPQIISHLVALDQPKSYSWLHSHLDRVLSHSQCKSNL